MKNKIINLVLILLFLLDTAYSFKQHKEAKLDGDMAQNIVPADDYKKVLNDPLAFGVLLRKETYAAPNRFFCHWPLYAYFKTVPLFLQKYTNPVDSVYLSGALFKTVIQCGLIVLIALYVFYFFKCSSLRDFLIIVLLIFPLFQTSGYNGYMGIIDRSITYTFFYAWPLCLTLLFFFPFFKSWFTKQKIELSLTWKIFLIFLSIVISLSGPLVPGVILIVSAVLVLNKVLAAKGIFSGWKDFYVSYSGQLIFYFGFACMFCAYSLYVGTFNKNNSYGETISVAERYARMPESLFNALTQKPGLSLLIISIILHCFLIKRNVTQKGNELMKLYRLMLVFFIIYILLIPFGGYRMYRPGVLRYDTLMPVTLGLLFMFASSAFYLLNNLTGRPRLFYGLFALAILCAFENADEPDVADYLCERNAIEKISASPEKIVELTNDCTIMSWSKTTDYNESDLNAGLFFYWGITKEKKLYYQK